MMDHYQQESDPDYHYHSSDRDDDSSSDLPEEGRKRSCSFSEAEGILATGYYESFTMDNSPPRAINGLHHRSRNNTGNNFRRRKPMTDEEEDGNSRSKAQQPLRRGKQAGPKKFSFVLSIFSMVVVLYMLLIMRTLFYMLQNKEYSSLFSSNDANAILPIRRQTQAGIVKKREADVQKRSFERQEHSRPPKSPSLDGLDVPWYSIERLDHRRLTQEDSLKEEKLASVEQLCGALAQKAAMKEPASFTAKGALNSKSVVLITGILNPVGFSLALQLKEKCGVQKVVGIDNMFPNTVFNRMQLQERMQLLTTAFPKMPRPVILPHIGLDPMYKKGASMSEAEINLMDLKPTHIVHLSSYSQDVYSSAQVDPQWTNTHSPYVDENGENSYLYQLRSSMVSMEQILSSILKEPEPPHFVYASSLIEDSTDPIQAITKTIDEILVDTYHSMSGSASIGLRFPNAIYGPWGQVGSPVHDVIEEAVQHWNATSDEGIDFSSNITEKVLDLLYVDDAVDAIVASLQYQAPKPMTMDIKSGTETTVSSFANALKSFVPGLVRVKSIFEEALSVNTKRIENDDILEWEPRTSLKEGVRRTIAWHLDRAAPYGPSIETGDKFLKRYNLETCAPGDLVCHKGYHYLPCSSECNIKEQCLPSIFDNVRELAKNTTEGCNLILYTQSLGYNVDDLHLHAEYMDEDDLNEGDLLLCNIAFVPRDSDLVKKVTEKVPEEQLTKFGLKFNKSDGKKAKRERKLEGLNGRLLYRGWILIWVEDAVEPLSITDRSMLKLSPGKLFAPDVQSALFVEENFSVSPNIEDCLFLVEELKRSAWPKRTVKRKVENDGVTKRVVYQLPDEPHRRAVILFAPLRYPNVDDPTVQKYRNGEKKLTIIDATKFMRYEAGFDYLEKEPQTIRRQREFYERIPSYVNRNMELRSNFEPYYRYVMRHWVRTRWVVHDVKLEESRLLRCDWYREHVQWGAEIDQLSFAHVMALREVKRRIAHDEPDDHVKTIIEQNPALRQFTDSYEWHAMETEENRQYHEPFNWVAELPGHIPLSTLQDEQHQEEGEKLPKDWQGVPLFIRIMSERTMAASRKRWIKKLKGKKSKDKKK